MKSCSGHIFFQATLTTV